MSIDSLRDSTRDTAWMDQAKCRDTDPELHFPISQLATTQIAEAVGVCARCPVKGECLAFAIDTGQDFGIWGGATEVERRKLKEARAKDQPIPPAKSYKLCKRCERGFHGGPTQLYCSSTCKNAANNETPAARAAREQRRAEEKARREAIAAEIAAVLG